MKLFLTIALPCTLLILFLCLNLYLGVSETTSLFVSTLAVGIGLAVWFHERLAELSVTLDGLKFKLREVTSIHSSVKKIGKAIVAVFETRSATYMQPGYDAEKANEAMRNLKDLTE